MAETSIKKVKIRLPYVSGSTPKERFVSVNGVNYMIPVDQEVEVPDYVAEEIDRANKMERYAAKEKERIKAQAQ